MKIKKLEINGFKSFVEKTSIGFPQGISAIVGPNGCGKSNVVDALRWVMGEQSVKKLRGKSMEDVIFSGSNGRHPLNMAEVSLTLANDNGNAPKELNDFTEVMLTRRLYRSGESAYFINKQPCRLNNPHKEYARDDHTGLEKIILFRVFIVLTPCRHGTGSCKRLEHFFACTADRAFPIVRQISKLSTFRNLTLSVSLVWIVNVSASSSLTLIHLFWFCQFIILSSLIQKIMQSKCQLSFANEFYTINQKPCLSSKPPKLSPPNPVLA
jgi:energy-coupling factor transporter ATP-binding protein EcfA2